MDSEKNIQKMDQGFL